MTVSFNITAEDLAAFSEHVVFGRHGGVIRARSFWTGVVVAVLVSAFLYTQVHEPVSSIVIGVVIGVVTALLLPKIEKDSLRKRTLRVYASTRDSSIGSHNLSVDGAGLHCSCPSGNSTTVWTAVNSIEFTPAYVFIFLGPAKAIVIPRSFVDDPAALETTLREFAQVPVTGSWRATAVSP